MASDATPQGAPEKPVLPGLKPLHRIGFGSSGEVWSCRNEVDGSVSAVKIVRRTTQDQRTWYKHELKALNKFKKIRRRPDSLLPVEHVAKSADNSFLYYTMPMADSVGGFPQGSAKYRALTLGKKLKHEGRLDLRETAEIAVRVAEALRALHANGLLHRDVKPDNILFIDGLAVLADIGLVTDDRPDASIAGTEKYMEPGKNPSKSTDLYALGKVLYRMANGLDPVDDFPECVSLNEGDDTALFRALNDICMRACGDDEERYSSADEMIADLRKALSSSPADSSRLIAGRRKDSGHTAEQPLPETKLASAGYALKRRIGEGDGWRLWIADVPGSGMMALKIEEFPECGADMDRRWDSINRFRKLAANSDSLYGIDRLELHPDCRFISYAASLPDDVDGRGVNAETYAPRTVGNEIERYRRLSTAEAIAIGRRVLAGLRILHEAGLSHGDVNPETVVFKGGRAILSRIAFPTADADATSPSACGLRTPPEVSLTPLGDIYMTGDLLCRMATGKRLKHVGEAELNIPDPLFPKLRHVIGVAGKRNPYARYVSAQAMVSSLDWIARQDISLGRKPQPSAPDIIKRLLSPRPPDPPAMAAFKNRIVALIGSVRNKPAVSGESVIMTKKDFADIAKDVCAVFERQIGFLPPIVKSACLMAEAVMEPSTTERKRLIKQASAIGGGASGIGMVIGGVGMALGWGQGFIQSVIALFVGGPVLWPIALVVGGVTLGAIAAKMYFSKETPAETADRALNVLRKGLEGAIEALWPDYGQYLSA